jgi:antimicrobial peptide system SdpB family protein
MRIKASLLENLRRLEAVATVEHRQIGLSLLRICLGCLVLDFHLRHIAQRAFLWGAHGVLPHDSFVAIMRQTRNFSVYMLSPSRAFEVAAFSLGILVTIAFILGYRTRISSILFYVFTWSLYSRNPLILDGGDNLLFLLAFYMMFADCGAYFSIDAGRRPEGYRPNRYRALLHNFAVAAIVTQLCLLYFTSAFFKMQGHMWQDGTAIYYVLRAAEFNLSPITHYLYDNAAVVTLLTWSTMIFQMAWPFLIWSRRARPVLAVGAIALHSMIGFFMGLVWFSAVMVSAELMIFDDLDYLRFGGWLAKGKAALSRRLARSATTPPAAPEAAVSPLMES